MKFTLLSFLVVTSTMLSLQAAKVINNTSETILISDATSDDIEELIPNEEYTTEKSVHSISAVIKEVSWLVNNLKKNDVIRFIECKDGTIISTTENPTDEK